MCVSSNYRKKHRQPPVYKQSIEGPIIRKTKSKMALNGCGRTYSFVDEDVSEVNGVSGVLGNSFVNHVFHSIGSEEALWEVGEPVASVLDFDASQQLCGDCTCVCVNGEVCSNVDEVRVRCPSRLRSYAAFCGLV